jgi:Protein of unknown function, DUF481
MVTAMSALRAIAVLVAAILPALLVPPAHAALRDKTDIVQCDNEDRVLCEIKEMKLGKLRVKTDTMSTVYIKWERVTGVVSSHGFLIETRLGVRYTGSLMRVDRPRVLSVYTSDGQVEIDMDDVVRILPVGQSFIERLDGHFDLGFNYTKSTDITQLNLSFSTIYQAEKYRLNLNYETNVTTKSIEGSKRRFDLNGGYRRYYRDRYYGNYSLGAARNDELGIVLRTYATAGFGRYFAQSSHHEFSGTLGLSVNRENASEDDSTSNVEGSFLLNYAFYRFKDPEANITTNLYWYPGLSEWGRHRIEYDVRLKYEIVSDFFWSLSVYYSYDSQPPGGATATDDYGIVNSFGYSW